MKQMNRHNLLITALLLAFPLIMSLPWLVPHTGFLALFGFVPLLCAERLSSFYGIRRFWLRYYASFLLWNVLTTFWVCNATIGGGIFACTVNAAQMALVFALFILFKRKFHGVLPYIFLAVCWIAWERWYFSAEISWPWLVLGNAFARSISLAQWYSVTGTLGGSLWIWACNLSIFGIMVCLSEGKFQTWNKKAVLAALCGSAVVILVPMALSEYIYCHFKEKSEAGIDAFVAQPDFDPYQKFTSLSQTEQNLILLDLFESEKSGRPTLFVAPETFTSDVILQNIEGSPTVDALRSFLSDRPGSTVLFGASTFDLYPSGPSPSILARPYAGGWMESHNSAIALTGSSGAEVFHKSKLVVGTEKMPYPRIFSKIDRWLGGVIARCVPQERISLLHLADGTPFGCAVCYESVYGEYCTGYVKQGAEFLSVITNDAWWGDTPGYRQHLSYSSLRAIELRRDIVRCANTGISAFINQRGDIVSSTRWWERSTLHSKVNANSQITPFVRYGDITGRACTLAFLLLSALLLCRLPLKRG